jgi:hypothetical protein
VSDRRQLHQMLSWPWDAWCDHDEIDRTVECNDKDELWAIFAEWTLDPRSSELVGYVCGNHKAKYEATL